MTLQTLELFAGTQSFSKAARRLGHRTHAVELDPSLAPDEVADVAVWDSKKWQGVVDVLWASPPCTCFSVASIGRHWTGGKRAYVPKTQKAVEAKALVEATLEKIKEIAPTWWFIENPRGVLRKMPFMRGMFRRTVTYCQYGDSRMKPTDIWTNAWWWEPKRVCRNGDRCHEAAPRGAKTGTQGIDGARDRGRIPPALFREIFEQMPPPATSS